MRSVWNELLKNIWYVTHVSSEKNVNGKKGNQGYCCINIRICFAWQLHFKKYTCFQLGSDTAHTTENYLTALKPLSDDRIITHNLWPVLFFVWTHMTLTKCAKNSPNGRIITGKYIKRNFRSFITQLYT